MVKFQPVLGGWCRRAASRSHNERKGWNLRHQLAEALSEQGSAYHQNPGSGVREVRHLFLWAKERSGMRMECLQD